MSFSNFFYRFDRASKMLLFFSFFDSDDFLNDFAKNVVEKPPIFIIDIKSSNKFLRCHKDLRSENF